MEQRDFMSRLSLFAFIGLMCSSVPVWACQGLHTWDFADPGAGQIKPQERVFYFLGRVVKTEWIVVEDRKLLDVFIDVIKDYRYQKPANTVHALAETGCIYTPQPGYIAKFGIQQIGGHTYLRRTTLGF